MKSILRHMAITSAVIFAINEGIMVGLSGGFDERWKDWKRWWYGWIDRFTGNSPLPVGKLVADGLKAATEKAEGKRLKPPEGWGRGFIPAQIYDNSVEFMTSIDDYLSDRPAREQSAFERMLIKGGRSASDFGAPTDGPAQIWRQMRKMFKTPRGPSRPPP